MPGSADSSAAYREALRAPIESASFLARAWAAAIAVEGSLRLVGYRRTLDWIEAVPRVASRRRRTSVRLGERLVRGAYRAHVFAGGCLPQSLVQYLLHRRDGTEARLIVGVRRPANETSPRSIEAHAWVESRETTPPAADTFAPIFSSGGPRRTDT